MRHNVDGRKFGRNTSHRVAMFRNLANSVIQSEQVVTTVEKAKEARRVVDRLITLGKTGTTGARRLAFDRTRSDEVVKKLFTTLSERYKDRAGGYTRVLRMSDRRWGDAASMAVLELVDHPKIDRKRKKKAPDDKQGSEQESKTTTEQPKDTYGKFRKLFSSKSKVGPAHGGKAHAKSGGAARKTPAAGGGGSKSGGSSS